MKTSRRGVELSRNRSNDREVFVSHANAALTPRARLRLARLVVDQGWPIARAAERYDVSWPTAKRWADRYRAHGPAGMDDRSSRPHHQPTRTPPRLVRRIVSLRRRKRLGPVGIGDQLGLASSTVHAVLRRCRLHRLSHLDRITGEPIRRYEHAHPGAMLHVDVKKLGNIPDGGGWRYMGKARGQQNRIATATRTGQRNTRRAPNIGTAYVHTVIDDHSRVAYAEIHNDETAATATAVLRNAVAWYADRGITTIERVLSERVGLHQPPLARHLRRTRHHTQETGTLQSRRSATANTAPHGTYSCLASGPISPS